MKQNANGPPIALDNPYAPHQQALLYLQTHSNTNSSVEQRIPMLPSNPTMPQRQHQQFLSQSRAELMQQQHMQNSLLLSHQPSTHRSKYTTADNL